MSDTFYVELERKKNGADADAINKFYKNLEKHNVTIGIHKEEGRQVVGKNNFTLIQNACIQEFGNTQVVERTRRFKSPYTGKWFYIKKGTVLTIPPRVFVRIYGDKKSQTALTNSIKSIIENNHYKGVLKTYADIGEFSKLQMKTRFLTKQIKPKNTQMTIAYKGSNTPLYLSGLMASSIKSEVH